MTTLAEAFALLPEGLKAACQWCVAGPDRAPYAVIGGQVLHASVHKRDQWKTLDAAIADAEAIGGGAGVGFMLTYEDPWTCIDLDVKNQVTQERKGEPVDIAKWTTPAEIERYVKILQTFDSYSEHSSGGYGIHIWVRGRIGSGARRQGVEVYSQERFIVCTGKPIDGFHKAIADRQELLETLVLEIRAESNDQRAQLEEIEPELSDAEIFDIACGAVNGEKFNALCAGKWKEMGFPSQSEADLALMSMLAFYSKSNQQCRDIFRCTTLGQREKAVKNDRYLNFTLEVIRGRQAREAAVSESSRKIAEDYVRELNGAQSNQADVSAASVAVSQTQLVEIEGSIDWPPGMTGAIADFIYRSSPRPVKEVAIVGALGLLAGICGKAFTIHQSGLNAYIILIARSGVGKEAMHSGVSHILATLRESVPTVDRFVDFTEYVSGPALKKAVSMNPSFVNVAGEFGRRLKRMGDDGKDGPAASLRTVMTDLYQKSGPASLVGGMGYSDKEKNVGTAQGVAFSMIGETTPGTFYEALTQSMMEDGFLSRFTVVDYNGERPPENENPQTKMNPLLAQGLQGLTAQAMNLISKFANQHVAYDVDASAIFKTFNKECDGQINGSFDESHRQMWNRAHLKVLRTAALLAVADNWLNPVVNKVHADWALALVRRDIKVMSLRINSGDVGVDDLARERKMISILEAFLREGPGDGYACPILLKQANIIPKRYLQIRLSRIACFQNARIGANQSLEHTIKNLMDLGYIVEVDKMTLSEKYSYQGKAYRVVSLPPLK